MPATTVNCGPRQGQPGCRSSPDTVGDVGLNYYAGGQQVDRHLGETGGAPGGVHVQLPCGLNEHAGEAQNSGDPTVVYDQLADRYIVADFAWSNIQNGPYYECIAVSKTGNPVTGGWWLYAVRADDAGHPWLPDYPKMGIWPDGLYMTANMFDCLNSDCSSANYEEVRVYAFNRSDLESGAALRSVVVDHSCGVLQPCCPATCGAAPSRAGQPARVRVSTPSHSVWKFHVVYGGPGSTFTGPTVVNQTSYTSATSTVPSSGNNLDSLKERMMMQNQYRNLSGTESLWVNHTVRTSSTGPNGIQWAQINVTGGPVNTTPVQQQIYGNVGNDGIHRWMGSLAVDGQGNMALGYSASKAAMHPDIRYNGRLAANPGTPLRRARRRCRPVAAPDRQLWRTCAAVGATAR
jgi:hypothetical protein